MEDTNAAGSETGAQAGAEDANAADSGAATE
jgi:hypothetical protein